MLLCLKGDKNAKTVYFFLDDLITNLSKKTIDALKKPNFLLKTGSVSNVDEVLQDTTLTKNENGEYQIKLNTAPNRSEGITIDAQEALQEVKAFFSGNQRPGINLEAGDLMILQNKRLFHGREAFEISTPFEERRWLQRMYVKKNETLN